MLKNYRLSWIHLTLKPCYNEGFTLMLKNLKISLTPSLPPPIRALIFFGVTHFTLLNIEKIFDAIPRVVSLCFWSRNPMTIKSMTYFLNEFLGLFQVVFFCGFIAKLAKSILHTTRFAANWKSLFRSISFFPLVPGRNDAIY